MAESLPCCDSTYCGPHGELDDALQRQIVIHLGFVSTQRVIGLKLPLYWDPMAAKKCHLSLQAPVLQSLTRFKIPP